MTTTADVDAGTTAAVPGAKPFFTAVITFEDQGDAKTLLTAEARHWRDEDRDAHETMGFLTAGGRAWTGWPTISTPFKTPSDHRAIIGEKTI